MCKIRMKVVAWMTTQNSGIKATTFILILRFSLKFKYKCAKLEWKLLPEWQLKIVELKLQMFFFFNNWPSRSVAIAFSRQRYCGDFPNFYRPVSRYACRWYSDWPTCLLEQNTIFDLVLYNLFKILTNKYNYYNN